MSKQHDYGFDSEFGEQGKQRNRKRKSQTSHGQRETKRGFDEGQRSTYSIMKRHIREIDAATVEDSEEIVL